MKEKVIFSKVDDDGGKLDVYIDTENKMLCWIYYPFFGKGWGNNYGSCYEVIKATAAELAELDFWYETEFNGFTTAIVEYGFNNTYATRGHGLTDRWTSVIADFVDQTEDITVEKFNKMLEDKNVDDIIDFLLQFSNDFQEIY